MESKGVVGQALLIYVDGETIACSTEASFNFNSDIEATKAAVGDKTWILQLEGVKKQPKLTLRPNDYPRKVKKRLKAFMYCKTSHFHYKGLILKGE